MSETPAHHTTGSHHVLDHPIQDPALLPIMGGRRGKERLPRTSLFVAVVGVIIITLTTVAVIAIILLNNKEAPDGLIGLAGVGMGSLGTFLARGQGTT